MRILVVSDAIGALSSAQAGRALAQGWPDADVAVVPAGAAGTGFLQAAADLLGAEPRSAAVEGAVVTSAAGRGRVVLAVESTGRPERGLPLKASSAPVGLALAGLLGARPRQVHLDLAGVAVFDGGAGLLGALGALADVPLDAGVAGLHGLGDLDLAPARALLGDTGLVGVVPAAELAQPLLGLRGITSRHGRPAGLDAEVLLRTDADLERLATLAAEDLAGAPGAGACGGTGLAVLALGGRLTTGPAAALDAAGAVAGARPDLVVTGCSVFDFAHRGGEVVAAAAALAAAALAPCVVVAGEVLIGAREMRTLGIEAAYPVRESSTDAPAAGDEPADLAAATARRVGRSWSW